MVNITLSKKDWDPNSKKFVKAFASSQEYVNKQVTLQSLSLYNSFFNVSAANGNNVVTFGILGSTYTHTLDNGYYTVSNLKYALEDKMVKSLLYVTGSDGKNKYFLDLYKNEVKYDVQLSAFLIPTSADATTRGYTKPSGAPWSYPESPETPTISFSSSFGTLIGFASGTYPTDITQDTQTLSTFSPEISVVNSLIMTCNLISNPGVTI
jgi:hypothetical protein